MVIPKFSACAAALMLLLPLLPVSLPEACAAPPPFGIGDWKVTGAEVLRDESLLLDGNLTVENGGSLTLINSTLQVICRKGDTHEIRVKSGGELKVLAGSVVGSFDQSEQQYARANFTVDQGASADFEDSTFISVGNYFSWMGGWGMVGGIFIYSSMGEVRNCTFIGNHVALTVVGCGVDFRSCRFSDNFYGPVSYQATTTFVNCTFLRNFIGAITYRSNSDFRDCTFAENAHGVTPDGATCTFHNCSFTHNQRIGLYCEPEMGLGIAPSPSDVTVEDCLFEANRVGIGARFFYTDELSIYPLYHFLKLVNCDFQNNTEAGLKWDRRMPEGGQETWSPCTWQVTKSSLADNETLDFNGNITVEAGGELELRRTALLFDIDQPGWNGLEVRSGGTLRLLDNSSLEAANASHPYKFACRPSSTLRVSSSRISNCGWETTLPEKAGPFIETSDARLAGSSVDSCLFALVLRGTRSVVVEGSSLMGTLRGLYLEASTLQFLNSSLQSLDVFDASLMEASVLDCINSSVDRYRMDVQDSASRLELAWYLDVQAAWSDGRPVPGAGLSAADSTGQEVHNATADAGGRLEGIVLREASVSPANTTELTPHRLRCWRGSIQNETDITMDRSQRLRILLLDHQPPSISFLYPRTGDYLDSTRVQLAGRAEDNLALGTVELTVDSFRHYMIYQSSEGELAELDWKLTLDLPEGGHTLEAVATDSTGNRAFVHLAIGVDTFSPRILITSPPDGFLTNLTEVAVSGVVEPGVEVFVNGEAVRTMANTFSGVARLSEGQNLIEARAVDRAGNSNSSSITVRLDTLPPAVEVSFDPNAAAVNQPRVRVFGSMEMGASITVNGRKVVLPGLADNFSTQVFLVPGANLIWIEAADAAGNVNTTERRMVLDTVPPALEVGFPPEGLATRLPALVISLRGEAGSNVTFGERSFIVEGVPGERADLTIPCTLAEGLNTLVLRARDAAGNSAAVTRHVTLDTLPPALELLSPANNTRTANATIYVMGITDPDARLTVLGENVEVGYGGAFSAELRLGGGTNRIVVRAEDRLGNAVEWTVMVIRVAGSGGALDLNAGPDWPFLGFLCLSAALAAGECAWAARRLGWSKKEKRNRGVG